MNNSEIHLSHLEYLVIKEDFGGYGGLPGICMCVLPFVYYTSLNEQLGSLSNFLSKNQNLGPVVHTQHHYLYSFYLCEVGWLSTSSISWFPTKPYFSFITSQASCLAMPPACCLVIFSYSCNCTLIANLNDLFFIFTYTCQ